MKIMKSIVVILMLVFFFEGVSFAEWLGFRQHDANKKGSVLVFKDKNLGSYASSGEDLMKMVQYGDAIMVDYGTECYVLDREFTKARVRITSGPSAGSEGWVYIESLRR